MSTPVKEVHATLNGLWMTFDAATGSIIRMEHPGPGVMLDTKPDKAGVIDLAYPIEAYEPLRLASRFSHGAKIETTADSVTITWDKLGSSRSFDLTGSVSAVVRMKADPDGKSIVMSCEIDNRSQTSVRQVLFPDFFGLLPFAGPDGTILKTGGFGSAPFRDLAITEEKASDQFCLDHASYSAEYVGGGMFSPMWMRWLDFGGLSGGFSLFPKRWGWEAQVPVRLYHSQTEEKLRMLCIHPVEIKPGEKWSSGEFVLTPHTSGWAKGIEPYRTWVKQHYKRLYSVPKNVREGLGYRTAFMSQYMPGDPNGDIVWKMSDLPGLAKECKDHGLTEMVLWAWLPGFELPLPKPYPQLGSEADMAKAVAECRKIGVNAAPFISVLQAGKSTASKYGLTVPDSGGWPQHTEMIPQFQAPYATTLRCAQVDTANALWQKESLESCKHLVDIGIPSLSCDQFWAVQQEPNIQTLASQIRAYAKKHDPESTFSGEELWNLEVDSAYLDYTWNWGGYRDCQAYTSVYPAPRRSCCVTFSPWVVKLAFADNMYINAFPRKADSVNGSDYIANYPDFSKALKQCANLRRQFLPYFTDGTLIGDCILTQRCPAAHITAYVLKDKVLMILLNQVDKQSIGFDCDLEPWIGASPGGYEVKAYDADGNSISTTDLDSSKWHGETKPLERQGMVVYEFTKRQRHTHAARPR